MFSVGSGDSAKSLVNTTETIRKVRPVACSMCPELPNCGGPDGSPTLDTAGCWNLCAHPDGCRTGKCRWTCPFNEPHYTRRLLDVGGSLAPIYPQLLHVHSESLPTYIPRLMTGIHAATRRPLNLGLAVVSLYEAVGFIRRNPKLGDLLHARFRSHYGLRPDVRVLLLGVARDSSLEGYWRVHQDERVLDGLRSLNVVGVTVPDFSFFTDVPRPDSMRNRRRMLLVADRLSRSGIPVIPHFNAGNNFDWEVWAELLRRNPSVTVFAKEFQTGHRNSAQLQEATDAMAKLQATVGRPLHPVLVSGFKAVKLLALAFENFTVIDAMPCVKALKLKQFQAGTSVRKQWTPSEETPADCLAGLIEGNVEGCAGKVHLRMIQSRTNPLSRSNLRKSWGKISSPKRTHQPLIFGHSPWKLEAADTDQLSMLDQPASLMS